ncbi:MAG TPA: helix-turn-helix domain-containing protein [Myxococcota bacterium]
MSDPDTTAGNDDDTFFSAAEVARYLGIHEKQVYRLMKKGGLPGSRVTGKWLFPKSLVDRFVRDSALAATSSSSAASSTSATSSTSRAIVIAGEADGFSETIAAVWNAGSDVLLARAPATLDRGLLLLAKGRVDGVVVEHAAAGCRGSIDRRLRRVLGGIVDERQLVRVRLGRRDVGVVGRARLGLSAFDDRRVVVREAGASTRTLVEHQLLRAGADPAMLLRQPVATSDQQALRQVLSDDVDGAVVGLAEARALGLQGTLLATLELSLLVPKAIAERELAHLGVVIRGAVRGIVGHVVDVDDAGAVTAVA